MSRKDTVRISSDQRRGIILEVVVYQSLVLDTLGVMELAWWMWFFVGWVVGWGALVFALDMLVLMASAKADRGGEK